MTEPAAVLTPGFDRDDRQTVVYCRVSSANQRADLISQRSAMEQFCLARGLEVDQWITEIGGGMNLTRAEAAGPDGRGQGWSSSHPGHR